MTVSKRLRYEVLRRDNHQCRYCGATAPGTPLTVDHYGLDTFDLQHAIEVTMRKIGRGGPRNVWRYFCGVCWRLLDQRREIATELLTSEEAGNGA